MVSRVWESKRGWSGWESLMEGESRSDPTNRKWSIQNQFPTSILPTRHGLQDVSSPKYKCLRESARLAVQAVASGRQIAEQHCDWEFRYVTVKSPPPKKKKKKLASSVPSRAPGASH